MPVGASPGSRLPGTEVRRVVVAPPPASASTDALFILMRRMRGPLVVLISIFAVDVFGLTLMPGTDAAGEPHRLTIFDAFYVMSYTATTIGFGELPLPFSTAQRMWVTFAIYSSVVGWAYALGSLFSLFQDRAFTEAVRAQRIGRQVRRLREPFLIIAGYGQMGRRIADALDAQGRRLVVVDSDTHALDQLEGGRLSIDVPGIDGDARDPGILALAGLNHPHCEGVVATTHDDSVNLAVAMAVQLLHPQVPVYARANDRTVVAAMRDFQVDGIINPFDRYGEYLALRLERPATYQLVSWLLAPYDAPLGEREAPLPPGRWLVAADDHFGPEIAEDLARTGAEVETVDPTQELPPLAGVVGLVAGSTDENRNLALAAHARLADPRIFISVRAGSEALTPLLTAFDPDSVFIPSRLTAEEAIARVITPDFWTFFQFAFNQDEAWSAALLDRLVGRQGTGSPTSRRISIDPTAAPGVATWLIHHRLTLGDLLRDPHDRDHDLGVVPLILTRGERDEFVPGDDIEVLLGDEIVVAGHDEAMVTLEHTLFHAGAVEYLATGTVVPETWIFRRLSPRIQDA
ncbi:potassium channel family protein [Tessaracoccus sp. G1721]